MKTKPVGLIIFLTISLMSIPTFSQVIPFGFFKTQITQAALLVYDYLAAKTVSSGGFITNGKFIAGSIETTFTSPRDIAIDSANDLMYVVDTNNVRVQKIVASTGTIVGSIGKSTAAGTCIAGKQNSWCTGGNFSSGIGDGQFIGPNSIAIDVSNDLMYIGDNNSIQKFTLSTGAFIGRIGNSTLSGSCLAGAQTNWCTGGVFSTGLSDGMFYSSKFSIQIDPVNDLMYMNDSNSYRIQKFKLSTGAFLGAIGKSTASGTCIAGVQNSWCVGGVFGSGTGDGSFSSPNGIAIDVTNNSLIVSNSDNRSVDKFTLSTGAYIGSIGYVNANIGTCVAGKQPAWCTGGGGSFSNYYEYDGGFSYPANIVLDIPNNRMYITDSGRAKVQKFVLSTGAHIGTIGNSSAATGTCVVGKQNGWCAGGYYGDSGSTDGLFNFSNGMAIDFINDQFYITDSNNNRIQKFTLSTGAFIGAIGGILSPISGWTKVALTGIAAAGSVDKSFNTPGNVVTDTTNDRIYISDFNRIQKFVLSTGAFIGAIGKSSASGTCIAGKQNAWCVGGVFTFGFSDGQFGSSPKLSADLTNGFLYATDSNRILKFNIATGAFIGIIGNSTAAGTCTAGAQASWCTGGAFSNGSGDGMFNNLSTIAVDAINNLLYVTDKGNYRIQKFTLSTGAFIGAIGNSTTAGTCVAGAQTSWCTGGSFSTGSGDGLFVQPEGLAIDIINNKLYVGDYYNISKFTLSTGAFIGSIGNSTTSGNCISGKQSSWCTGGVFSFGTGDGMFSSGVFLAIDSTGNRLFSGQYNKIQKFNLTSGDFLGSIGNSNAAGSCIAGAQIHWCQGGTFTTGAFDGMFNSTTGLVYNGALLYVVDSSNNRIQRISP